MLRICPSCKKTLRTSDYYFCSSCGSELDSTVSQSASRFNLRLVRFHGAHSKMDLKPLKYSALIVVLLVGFFILVKYGSRLIPKGIFPTNTSATLQNTQTVNTVGTIISTDLSITNVELASTALTKAVPFETDFYAELADFNSFYTIFVESFSEKPIVDKFLSDLEPNAVISGRKKDDTWELGVFFKVKNQNNILELLGTTKTDKWRIVLIKDMLLFSNSDTFIEDSVSASNAISKNITQNPKYVAKRAQLQEKGQLLFINISDDYLSTLDLLRYYKASSILLEIADEAKRLEYDKFVLVK